MITILGATGNVGSKTAEILLKQGKQVRLIARHEDKLKHFSDLGAEIAVGDSKDAVFLTKAFRGSDVVLTMIPGDFSSPDIGAHQNELGNAQIQAIKDSGIKKVVFISSVGGHTEEKTGIVAGLARQEVRLNALEGVDVKILRPTYFMENLLGNIGMIKNMGFNGSAIDGSLPMPLIATQDIAAVAAEYLSEPSFKDKSVRALLGPRNYTMTEITSILGNAIGRPDLKYVQFPYADAKAGMVAAGLSESLAESYIGLMEGINEGVFNLEIRNSETSTPTTVEEFSNTFAYVYNM